MHSCCAQHLAGTDERQTHQSAGIVVVDALQKRDTQAFAFGAPCAVVGLLGKQVVFDLGVRQRPKHHPDWREIDLFKTVRQTNHGDRRLKNHGLAAHATQLGDRALVCPGFAQCDTAEVGDLVAADHDRLWVPLRHIARLGQSQAQGERLWCFARCRSFIHARAGRLEGYTQSLKQFPAVARSGSQDKRSLSGVGSGGENIWHGDIVPWFEGRFFYTAKMKTNSSKTWNPRRLDVRAFAEAGATFQADLPLTSLKRLLAERVPDGEDMTMVTWQANGEMRPGNGGTPGVWLHLQASTDVPLSCQRCLAPVITRLDVDRWFRFVADEAMAEAEDDESEEDVLALEPRPDLLDLLEDELLMALPLVPMHEACPAPLPAAAGDLGASPDEPPTPPHPFAALARLRK